MDHQVYIALGANLGDPLLQMRQAITLLGEFVDIVNQSPVYLSRPAIRNGSSAPDDPGNQPFYYNMAVCGSTRLAPHALLHRMKKIETIMGRVRRFRDEPRLIDLDLIFYDSLLLKSDDLTLPHPRAHLRDFVLKPLVDLGCSLSHPQLQQDIPELFSRLEEKNIVRQISG